MNTSVSLIKKSSEVKIFEKSKKQTVSIVSTAAEMPQGLKILFGRRQGLTYLLLNVSRLCNQQCEGCFTWHGAENMKRYASPENIIWLNNEALKSLLTCFKQRGGLVVAVMADGETMFGINLSFVKRIVEISGELQLGNLLFTNGLLLDSALISELFSLNSNITYAISIKGGSERGYKKAHGDSNGFKKIMANRDAWREYNLMQKKKLKESAPNGVDIHRIYIHTCITASLTPIEMNLIRETVKYLGNVPHIVTTMANAGDARVHPEVMASPVVIHQLISDYGTGPAAAQTDSGLCSYIISDAHKSTPYGITINPFRGGTIQPCPYLSHLGSDNWFSLKDYLSSLKSMDLNQQQTDFIGIWFDHALVIESVITSGITRITGQATCIMRDPKIMEVENYLKKINKMIEEQLASSVNYCHTFNTGQNITHVLIQEKGVDGYFREVIKAVESVVNRIK